MKPTTTDKLLVNWKATDNQVLSCSSGQNVTVHQKKLDEEKSKHASLGQRNSFGPAFVFLHSLLAETGQAHRKA